VTGSDQIPAQNSMLYGALAAVTSATVSFPLEVVRRRMMLGTAKGNTLVAIMQIAQNEGVGALYKGVLLTWVKQVGFSSIVPAPPPPPHAHTLVSDGQNLRSHWEGNWEGWAIIIHIGNDEVHI